MTSKSAPRRWRNGRTDGGAVAFEFVLKQVYFCIGAAKTGTTILARLLDQQPGVACLWEGYLLRPRHTSSVINPESNAWQKHGFARERVGEWHEQATHKTQVDGNERDGIRYPGVVRQIITEVLEDFGARTGADVVGDKWPYYWKSLPLMVEAFPEARFVYNVRDPRAVWNSGETFKKRGLGDEILDEMMASEAAVRGVVPPDRLIVIRYEDLIRQPATTMVELAGFIGFDFSAEALEYSAADDPLPDRWNWVPEAKGDLDAALTEKWRFQMPRDQQRRVSELCSEFIERYGYAQHP